MVAIVFDRYDRQWRRVSWLGMPMWLVKSDPDDYSAADLERDKRAIWTGVTNALAQRHMRAMAAGDEVLIYHTGDEKRVVARGIVAENAGVDPNDKSQRAALVTLEFSSWLRRPVSLAELKAEELFANFDLVRNSRLSVMPASAAHFRRILKLAEMPGKTK